MNCAFRMMMVAALSTAGLVLAPRHGLAQLAEAQADPKAVVVSGQARFSVLTSRLLRLEWSEKSVFEDRASLVFVRRRLPVPPFTTATRNGWLTIATEHLVLRYRPGKGPFAAGNLEVQLTLNGRPIVWRPGLKDTGNLLGTTHAIDGANGPVPLEPGLLSRDGWAIVDDTARPVFDTSEWPWMAERPAGARQDLYFFGYGHDYRAALADFSRVAGPIPMPPRFAFGAWWSRDWTYTDQELRELVREFDAHSVPLDVLAITHWNGVTATTRPEGTAVEPGQSPAGAGFNWDRTAFPDPEGFLRWCDARGLKTPLSLGAAPAVRPEEAGYAELAKIAGVDPATRAPISIDLANHRLASAFLDLVIRPLDKQGVDFWWLDWPKDREPAPPLLAATWWAGHVFFSDMERRAERRPLLLNRWGGLGSHRYPIGYSGRAPSTWQALAFQPYFTATAGNVGFAYWSHDIGGSTPGRVEPELYTRWLQFGALSPVLRTNAARHPDAERRLWAFPLEYAKPMRDAVLLRYALVPYLYTAARQAFETGLPIVRPMYLDDPEIDEAYAFKDQYLFGNDLLVAPIVSPRAADTRLTARMIWLPPGTWFEWFSGARFEGSQVIERTFTLDEIPIYVRAGAVIPMQPPMRYLGERPVDPLILMVFPGAAGSTRIYEDQGHSLGYQREQFAWLTVRHLTDNEGVRHVQILPVEGSFPEMPAARSYEIRLRGTLPPQHVSLSGPAASKGEGPRGWAYDGETLTTVVRIPKVATTDSIEVLVTPTPVPAEHAVLVDRWAGLLVRLRALRDLINRAWPRAAPPDLLVSLVQAGSRMTARRTPAAGELAQMARGLAVLPAEIDKLDLLPDERAAAKALLAALALR